MIDDTTQVLPTTGLDKQIRNTTKTLVFRCILALVMMGALALSHYGIFTSQIMQSKSFAASISLSAQQQSRVTYTAYLVEQLVAETEPTRRAAIRTELRQLITDMQTTSLHLIYGQPELNLPPATTLEFSNIYLREPYYLEKHMRHYTRALNNLAGAGEAPLSRDDEAYQDVQAILNAGKLQDAIAALVDRYRAEGETNIYRVELLNNWLFGSMAFVLLLIALLIFLPMIMRIRKEMVNLGIVNASLEQRVADRTAALIARARDLERSNNAMRELRAALENAVEGIARIDQQGEFRTVNTAFVTMFGWEDTKELRKQPWQTMILPDDQGLVVSAMEIAEEMEKAELEVRGVRQNGAIIHISLMLIKAVGRLNRFDGFHCFAKDISDRKVAENALRESDERFRQLADNVKQVMWLSEVKQNNIIYVNPAFEEIFGLECASLYETFDAWTDAIHPDDQQQVFDAINTQESGGRYDIEYRIVRQDGEIRWIRDRAFPIHRSDGSIYRIAGIAEDITSARDMQQQLMLSRRSFENLIMNCDVAMLVTDSEGVVKFVNPAAEQLLHTRAEELLEKPFSHATDDDEIRELEICKDDNSMSIAEMNLIRTEWNGEVAHLLIFHEITDRKRAQIELTAYADELKRSNKELEDFAFVASHDLQEPLRKIKAFGDRLVNRFGDQLDDDGKMYLERMQGAAIRMDFLIRDLLTYSRVTTKAQPFKEVDLNNVVKDVLSDLEVRIEQSRGTVEVSDLVTIDADRTQMRQLFQNLIGNALKFRQPETAPVVKVSCMLVDQAVTLLDVTYQPNQVIELRVADNGIGFDEKYLDRIFDVFQRLHGRGAYEGTGTGLAVCRKIVSRHGGVITAQSAPGEGATFIVHLPSHQA